MGNNSKNLLYYIMQRDENKFRKVYQPQLSRKQNTKARGKNHIIDIFDITVQLNKREWVNDFLRFPAY